MRRAIGVRRLDPGVPDRLRIPARSLFRPEAVFDVVGTIASGWFTDRFEPRRPLAVYYALCGVALPFLPMLPAPGVHPPMVFSIVF